MSEPIKREFGKSGYAILPLNESAGGVVEIHTHTMSAALILSMEEGQQLIADLINIFEGS
jgi:hypothetical protein